MREYMATFHPGVGSNESMPAVAETYVSTVLMPAAAPNMSQRNERELRTLALSIDLLVRGDSARAADILMQRFKAVETASMDGNWAIAKHLELLPPTAVTAVPVQERESAALVEKAEVKLRNMAKNVLPH